MQFCLRKGTTYAVNACVDGVVVKAGIGRPKPSDSPAEKAWSLLLTAEFKGRRAGHQVFIQMAFEFAARISARYGDGGEDVSFNGQYA